MRRALVLLKIALRNVFRQRRSLYAVFSVAMGAMGLFVFMGFNRGLMNQYRENAVRARWGNGMVFMKGYWGKAHSKPWEEWVRDSRSVQAGLAALPGVLHVFPRLPIQAVLSVGDRSVSGIGDGVDGAAEAAFFNQLNYEEGGDFKGNRAGIVLGKGLAEGLGIHVGDAAHLMVRSTRGQIEQAEVEVTGVFHTGAAEFDSRAFRVHIVLAQRLMGTDRVEGFSVATRTVGDWPVFAPACTKAFPVLEAISFDDLDKVYYGHAVDWLDAQFGFIRGIIILIVFLGILNMISMTVLERTREIGTLRANGDGRAEIALGMIIEAGALGIMGGLIGILAGVGITYGPLAGGIPMPPAPGITRSFRIIIELGAADSAQVILLCALTAMAGCLWPVWRAIRMPIAEALRHT